MSKEHFFLYLEETKQPAKTGEKLDGLKILHDI